MTVNEVLEGTGLELPSFSFNSAAFLTGLLWFLIIVGIILFGFIIIRNKLIFKFPIVIYARRGMGRKIRTGKGGYIRKKGLLHFKIKWGKLSMPWMKKTLDFLPDTNLMDADGRLHFDQLDPETYVQKRVVHVFKDTRKRKVKFLKAYYPFSEGDEAIFYENIINPIVQEGTAVYLDTGDDAKVNEIVEEQWEPVGVDQKRLAIQEIRMADMTLKTNKLKGMLIGAGVITVIILIIFGILFFTSK